MASQPCLFFGTFNPVHTGHLIMAQSVYAQFAEELNLSGVTFIPAADPPHRKEDADLAPARQRLRMVRLATASNPRFRVSDIEFRRAEPSYTAETVRALTARHPEWSRPFPMIIGSDSVAQLATWREPEFLIEALLFLQVVRPGQPFVERISLGGREVSPHTRRVSVPELEISATTIRERLKHRYERDSVRYLAPDAVVDYILDNGLYR